MFLFSDEWSNEEETNVKTEKNDLVNFPFLFPDSEIFVGKFSDLPFMFFAFFSLTMFQCENKKIKIGIYRNKLNKQSWVMSLLPPRVRANKFCRSIVNDDLTPTSSSARLRVIWSLMSWFDLIRWMEHYGTRAILLLTFGA